MAERKRNKEIHFYVTEEERKLIRRKMIESKTKNMGAYLRKMAIDGYIVNTDTTPLKKQYEEMHKIGININQIAKKVNTTGDLYPEEMQELKEMVKELWHILRSSPLKYQTRKLWTISRIQTRLMKNCWFPVLAVPRNLLISNFP